MGSMEKEQEITYLLFDLIVKQLEGMSEQNRAIRRVEVTDSSLELTMKTGEEYRIDINRVHLTEEEKGRVTRMDRQQGNRGKQIAEEDWARLAHSCETVIQFLEYDKRKMEELATLLPDFPWKKRSLMIEEILEQLRESLFRASGRE
ncbi:hypothetical protein SAMN05421790_11150 [Kroppenstedtia eburnea]|uniref:Uncharacterized protein n=1 Tax=Kroppenstedtia eburnea TaxID=714067 RepID=A0A1N7P3X0_9BACL|nr:hypothetical protein SAMN05421790_11150 [Kroppenstedtia eburnea]